MQINASLPIHPITTLILFSLSNNNVVIGTKSETFAACHTVRFGSGINKGMKVFTWVVWFIYNQPLFLYFLRERVFDYIYICFVGMFYLSCEASERDRTHDCSWCLCNDPK